jgi:hypothetical protein
LLRRLAKPRRGFSDVLFHARAMEVGRC